MLQKRLFDLLDNYTATYPNKEMFHAKINKQWHGETSTVIKEKVYQLANTLRYLGLGGIASAPEHQDKVAIISGNRPEWVITDFAIQIIGAVSVPVYPSITETELTYILNEAEVKVLFIENKLLYKKFKDHLASVSSLKQIYCYDEIDEIVNIVQLYNPINNEHINAIENIKKAITTEQLATIIYTSGTTGNPKGVMLSHYNIMSNVESCIKYFVMCDDNGRILSFLPLNHILERMITYIYLRKGVQIFFAEGMETIGENLREIKPHVFATVPRLLEKVYERIIEKGATLQGMKKTIFDWALQLACNSDINTPKSIWYKIQLAIADKLVYSKWRQAVGGELKAIITGSAACQIKLIRMFTAAKLIVMEGYGLTETSPVISINRFEEKDRKFGTVGPIISDIEVKIAEDGEILFKGPNLMMGYYKHPELTEQVIINGWFHTGDIGEIIDGRFLKITDRKKELFKISGGKYVAPLPLESKIKESPFIDQIMVVGSNEKFVGALIVPNKSKLKAEANKQNIAFANDEELLELKEVQRIIRKELDTYNLFFSEHERVKKFQLLKNEWTIDTGELTPSLKIKRRKIVEKYGDLIAKIYS